MTVKEYQTKYKLAKGSKFNREAFVKDMTEDFNKMLESQGIDPTGVNKKRIPYKRFSGVVDTLYQKWLNIFNSVDTKVDREDVDKFWGFFFASVVAPYRANTYPDKYHINTDRIINNGEKHEDKLSEDLAETAAEQAIKSGKISAEKRVSNSTIRKRHKV
ncbi:MAG: hypothetical protein J5614_05290 [Paludibacteraceae bacterium]|nr:hypothetical protein [Paludibacteraceae bacterium]